MLNLNFNVYFMDNEFIFVFLKMVKGVMIGNIGYNMIRFRNILDVLRWYLFLLRVCII